MYRVAAVLVGGKQEKGTFIFSPLWARVPACAACLRDA
jgi:hypothetical protein